MRMTAPPTRMTAPPMRMTAPPTRTTAPPMRMTAPPTRMTAPPTRMTAPPMRVNWEENRGRPKPPPRPTARRSPLQAMLEQSMLQISVAAVIAGSLGWSWLIYSEFRSPVLVAPAIAAVDPAAVDVTSNVVKSAGTPAYARIERPSASGTGNRPPSGESAASIVAREWSFFEPKHLAEGARAALRQAAREQRIAKNRQSQENSLRRKSQKSQKRLRQRKNQRSRKSRQQRKSRGSQRKSRSRRKPRSRKSPPQRKKLGSQRKSRSRRKPRSQKSPPQRKKLGSQRKSRSRRKPRSSKRPRP